MSAWDALDEVLVLELVATGEHCNSQVTVPVLANRVKQHHLVVSLVGRKSNQPECGACLEVTNINDRAQGEQVSIDDVLTPGHI